ncbi:MAG: hypothetical protein A3K67_04970 [Euryarchaeota archaeon RBG_16_62_10]|nr:MAG: hypothetical protein A3K67_04970 [Euryarchaeota archaeon RBG_16_62_10]
MELSILVYVLLMIAFAKALGEAVSRVNQPPIVGELLAGIILGPFLLGAAFPSLQGMYAADSDAASFISDLADLGMLFLMLYVGLEFSTKLIRRSSWVGAMIALGGLALPLVLGLIVGVLFDLGGLTLYFVAVAMSVTALPVTIRVLKDLEVLQTDTGATIISAALITDVLLLFSLGLILGAHEGEQTVESALYLAAGFVGFFVLAILIGRYAIPHVYRLLRWMRTGEAAFAIAIGFAIGLAVLAEWAGLPGVIGAFIGGLLLRETGTGLKVWARVEDILSGVTLGFLAPIFFVLIGFSVQFDTVADNVPFLLAIVVVAVLGKLAGSYLPARASGLRMNESMAIGSMMIGKGAMELVFARIALETDLIDESMFSLLVLMAFISTVLAPMLFRTFYIRAVSTGEVKPVPSERGMFPDRPDTTQYG